MLGGAASDRALCRELAAIKAQWQREVEEREQKRSEEENAREKQLQEVNNQSPSTDAGSNSQKIRVCTCVLRQKFEAELKQQKDALAAQMSSNTAQEIAAAQEAAEVKVSQQTQHRRPLVCVHPSPPVRLVRRVGCWLTCGCVVQAKEAMAAELQALRKELDNAALASDEVHSLACPRC